MYKNEIGKVYGELKIKSVSKQKTKNDGNRWFAVCECTVCGAIGETQIRWLLNGKTKSCRRFDNRVEFINNHVKIFLHSGEVLLIDQDFYKQNNNKRYHIGGKGYPSQGTGWNGSHSTVHRAVMRIVDPKIIIDHKNRDRLDARENNLRVTTISQNGMNQRVQNFKTRNKTSKYKGVQVREYTFTTSFYSRIKKDGIQYRLGKFESEIEAAKAYDKAALRMFGEYAGTNKSMGLL